MAHLRNIERRCDEYGCGKPATVGLYSIRNVFYGDYCKKCGERALAQLKANENEELSNRASQSGAKP